MWERVGNVFWLKLVQGKILPIYTSAWMILKSMVRWVLACRASKDSHSRWSSIEVTILVLLYLLVTYLAARRCTISTLLTYSLVWGLQTAEQYSMIGLTIEKWAADLFCSFEILRLRQRNPREPLAFLKALSMWQYQDMLGYSSPPRYRVESSMFSVCPFRV